jgi:DNA-binding transcriptional LysR family regulator
MARDLHIADLLDTADLLKGLAAFVVVVECGGYSAAARRSRTDKATLSRRVRALEDGLELRLFDRTTRSVRLTEAGQDLFDQTADRFYEILGSLQRAGTGPRHSGRVRVTSVPGLAESVWAPVLSALQASHPGIDVVLHTSGTYERLVETGLDLGIRSGKLPVTSDVARKLAVWRYAMVASPAWIAAHPWTAPEGEAPVWIHYPTLRQPTRWCFETDGVTVETELTPVLMTDDVQMLLRAAVDGMGVLLAAPSLVQGEVEAGRLARVLPTWRVAHTHTVYSVVPHREYMPPAVQVVRDAVHRRLEALAPVWSALTD